MEDKKLLIELNKYIQDEDMPTVKSLIESRTKKEVQQLQEVEKITLKRLALEFKAVKCDCGEPWTPSDAEDIVLKRLSELESTIDKDTKE